MTMINEKPPTISRGLFAANGARRWLGRQAIEAGLDLGAAILVAY